MSWNYRVIRHTDGSHALHEVYYADDGALRAMSKEPASFGIDTDESVTDLVLMLERALKDATTRPVLPVEVIQVHELTNSAGA